jgi:hypothetical protein
MGQGLKRLRGSAKAESIRKLNREGQQQAEKEVVAARPAPLPKIMVPRTQAQLLQRGLLTAVAAMKRDCKRLHAAATGKQRERLYGELLGYDAVLKVLGTVELAG